MSQFNVPAEQQENILRQRIEALNLDGFQQELNRTVAFALGETEQVDAADNTISVIATAINEFENILAGIVTDPTVEPVTDPEVTE